MLDHVSIAHESGLVLYSRSFNPNYAAIENSPSSPVVALFESVLVDGKRQQDAGFEKNGFSVRWARENELGLVFVVVFPALLPLTYIPSFLSRIRQLFLSLFQPYVQALVDSLSAGQSTLQTSISDLSERGQSALRVLREKIQAENWEYVLQRCLRSCEEKAGGGRSRKAVAAQSPAAKRAETVAADSAPDTSSETDAQKLTAEEIAKNVHALKGKMKGGSGGKGRGGRGSNASPSPSRPTSAAGTATSKIMRKWGTSSSQVTAEEMAALDYSTPPPSSPTANGAQTPSGSSALAVDVDSLVDKTAFGTRGKDGLYEVADWDAGRRGGPPGGLRGAALLSEEEIIAKGYLSGNKPGSSSVEATATKEDAKEETTGALSSLFSRLTTMTSSKTLTKEDLAPVLQEMEKHLMSKNVAKDIAEKLCESVGNALVGKKLGGFGSVKSEVNSALSAAITRVLTPKTSTDILLDIKRKSTATTRSVTLQSDSPLPKDPYTMTFVGVNGVGKSTNLSKVCFWLLQNRLRVLIAACDTFRSGAVEQLRVHVRNLSMLGDQLGTVDGEVGGNKVELYERGYGKDAAGIAKDAIVYAKENGFDVVLIDTAGRMQDNEPLMRALAKLVSVNNPDKIIFVGEALVGNEAVDQLSKFDRALRDFTAAGLGVAGAAGVARGGRGIDGMILTKFDTIDDKVGAALSMTYITGQPIIFVGCGQTYTDLRHLKVNHIVEALLSA